MFYCVQRSVLYAALFLSELTAQLFFIFNKIIGTMKQYLLRAILFLFSAYFVSCSESSVKSDAALKEELKQVENSFSDSSLKKGFYHALIDFAANDIAMFQTGDTVIRGMDYIHSKVAKFPAGTKPPFTLTWEPEKIEVAASGDLGYTYGWYVLITEDSTGYKLSSKGLYNSFWRKVNGEWKLVLD